MSDMDLSPRTSETGGGAPAHKKRNWLPIVVLALVVVAGGVIITKFLNESVDYYCNVDEIGVRSGCDADRRLRLQGVVCLHASAMATSDGEHCFALMAPGGYGKSTTAAAFAHRGLAVLTEDVLASRYSYYDLRVKNWKRTFASAEKELLAAPTDAAWARAAARMLEPTADLHLHLKLALHHHLLELLVERSGAPRPNRIVSVAGPPVQRSIALRFPIRWKTRRRHRASAQGGSLVGSSRCPADRSWP